MTTESRNREYSDAFRCTCREYVEIVRDRISNAFQKVRAANHFRHDCPVERHEIDERLLGECCCGAVIWFDRWGHKWLNTTGQPHRCPVRRAQPAEVMLRPSTQFANTTTSRRNGKRTAISFVGPDGRPVV